MELKPHTGVEATILLWSFEVTARDRRTGKRIIGSAVEVGEKSYNIEGAIEAIERKYSLLGYEVLAAKFIKQQHFKLDTVKLADELPDDKAGETVTGDIIDIEGLVNREYVKEDYSSWESNGEEVAAALSELERGGNE